MIPDSHFLLGHLPLLNEPDFRKCIHTFAVEHADENGRVCFWMGPSTPALSVTRAEDVQHVLKHSSYRTLFSIMERHNELFLGRRNIAVLNGREWKQQRAVLLKALHATANLKSHNQIVVDSTLVLVNSLTKKLELPVTREIGELMKMLTFDIFGQAAMTTDFGCCQDLKLTPIVASFEFLTADFIRRLSTDILNPTSHIYSLPTARNREHAHYSKYLREYIEKIISERQELLETKEDCPQDLLTKLIQLQQEAGDDISKETLSDTLLSLLFAGYETTSVALTYALYLISQYSQVESRCLEEIGKSGGSLDPENYVYLQAVLTETLRLYPPGVSTTRNLEKELVVGDVTIPKDTYMYIPIWAIQRDPKNFPDPESFRPERWLEDGDGNRGAFCAFSAGARSCVGQRFAMAEMTLVLSILLSKFSFRVADDDYVLVPHRMSLVQSPKDGIPMTIQER